MQHAPARQGRLAVFLLEANQSLAACTPLRRSQRQRKQVDYTYNDYNETILDAVRLPASGTVCFVRCLKRCLSLAANRPTQARPDWAQHSLHAHALRAGTSC